MGSYQDGSIEVYPGDVSDCYEDWETPTTIISDGAYGIGLFPDEPDQTEDIPEWYEPHIRAWSEHATPETTLWFWNTELGWAEVHPLLKEYGWEYRGANIWTKGIGHIAGNSNTKKLRKFPQVTEVCVHYVKKAEFTDSSGKSMSMQEWIISEWERTGLPRQDANDACGVADAASRKYLTKGDLWYYPPPERMEAMVEYANEHGDPEGKPYFAPDGENPVDAEEWKHYRAKFDLDAGITNIWEHPRVNGNERLSDKNGDTAHINQKPLKLARRIIKASTDPGDVVWEPFGGLCTGAVAARELGRECRSAEMVDEYYEMAVDRLENTERNSHRKDVLSDEQTELETFQNL